MKKRILLLLFSVIGVIGSKQASAQDFRDAVLTGPSNLRVAGNSNSLIIGSTDSYTLPVIFWVVMRNATDTLVTRAQIDSARVWLNRDFANTAGFAASTGMSFAPAKRDPSGNATTGIKYVDGSILPAYARYGVNVVSNSTGFSVYDFGSYNLTWDHQKYINVYIVDSIYNGYGGSTTNIPTFSGEGVFIKASEILRNTHSLSHEMGHYFNLLHTFEGQWTNGIAWQCPLNDNCATQGDQVCDTPPHTSSDLNSSPCYSGSDFLNSGHNFMSYAGHLDDRFTAGQTARMRDYLFNTRAGLVTSDALIPVTTPIEVAVIAIENQDIEYVCGNFIPQFTLKNLGTNNITNCKAKIYIDDVLGLITPITSMGLASGQSKAFFTAAVPVSVSTHTIRVEVSDVNGMPADFFLLNNSMYKSINFQKETFHIVALDNTNVTSKGTADYLCEAQFNLEADFDTAHFDFMYWKDQNDSIRSHSRYWSANADGNWQFTPTVHAKTLTGIKETTLNEISRLYPNPANSNLQLEIASQKPNTFTVSIVDIVGQIVTTQEIHSSGHNTVSFDVANLAKGEYLVRLIDDEGSTCLRFLKQ